MLTGSPSRWMPLGRLAAAAAPALPYVRRLRLAQTGPPAVVLLAVSIPIWAGEELNLIRFELLFLYLTVALATNLMMGFAGELVIGYPVVFGLSAYVAAVLSVQLNWGIGQTLPVTALAAALVSVALTSPGFRVKGWYLALITFFAVIIFPDLVVLFKTWTAGDDGLTGITPINFLGHNLDSWAIYEVTLLVAILTWIAIRNLVRSNWGLVLRSIRDCPQASQAMGINPVSTRLLVALLAGVPVGVAGALFAHSQQVVSHQVFGIYFAILIFAGVLLGGAGTLCGPVLGTLLLQFFSFWVGPFSEYNVLILGLALLVIRIFFPRGLIAALAPLWQAVAGAVEPARLAGGVSPADAERPAWIKAQASVQPVLAAQAVTKAFGGNVVLRGVDLDVESGRLVALVGPNGSGKTTFINILTGFIRPDGGTIGIAGRAVRKLAPFRIGRAGVSRSFQVPQLIDELSTRENIELAYVTRQRQRLLGALFRTRAWRRDDAERRQIAESVCGWLELDPNITEKPTRALSLGLKRVVEVGRAVAAGPVLVCLDEPAAGLNHDELAVLGRSLKQLAAAGPAVLLIEHNLPFVLDICDEVVLLMGGRVTCRWEPGGAVAMPAELHDYLHNVPTLKAEESAS